MSNLCAKTRAFWESLGHRAEGDFFKGYGRVISKQRVWDHDSEQGNAAYMFVVSDEASKHSLSFRASPAFPACAVAKPGDRICYTYIYWGSVLPVNLKLANAGSNQA
jgi:hypothetical protein